MRSYSLIQAFHLLYAKGGNDQMQHSELEVFAVTDEAKMKADEMAESLVRKTFQDLSKQAALLWILLQEVKAHFQCETARKIVGWERREVLKYLQELVKNSYLVLHPGGWYEVVEPPKKEADVLKIGMNGLPVLKGDGSN